jgi:hypothetical protein
MVFEDVMAGDLYADGETLADRQLWIAQLRQVATAAIE